MGEIGSNTGRVDNIVESKLVNKGAQLEKKRQRLFISSCQSVCEFLDCLFLRSSPGLLRTWPIPPEAPATTVTTKDISSMLLSKVLGIEQAGL